MVRRVMVTARPPWQPLHARLKERRLMTARRARGGFMARAIRLWLVENGADTEGGFKRRLAAEGGQ